MLLRCLRVLLQTTLRQMLGICHRLQTIPGCLSKTQHPQSRADGQLISESAVPSKKSRLRVMELCFGATVLLCSPGFGANLTPGQAIEINNIIDRMNLEKSPDLRAEDARGLEVAIKKLCDEGRLDVIDIATTGRITNLLNDRSDAVRMWIAGALGLIGPKASGAAPALRRALSEVELSEKSNPNPLLPEVDSREAIRTALDRIAGKAGGRPPQTAPVSDQ